MKNKKGKWTALSIGGLLAFFVVLLRGEWNAVAFSDGFAIAGALLCSYGGLRFLASKNAFTGLGFIGLRIRSYLLPFTEKNSNDYAAYREKTEKEKHAAFDCSTLTVGGSYLLLGALLILFV